MDYRPNDFVFSFGTRGAIKDKHKGRGTPAFIKEASLAKLKKRNC